MRRYKTIFMGSRLDARLLGEHLDDYDSNTDDSEEEFGVGGGRGRGRGLGGDVDAAESGRGRGSGRGAEESKGHLQRQGASRKWRRSKQRDPHRRSSPSPSRRRSLSPPPPRRYRQESTRELVDYFAERMQEARDAWSARVQALQKRWQASFIRGDWGLRGGGSALADRDAALRLTFGLIVRMYAYEDALEDLRLAAEQYPSCLEAFAPQVEDEEMRIVPLMFGGTGMFELVSEYIREYRRLPRSIFESLLSRLKKYFFFFLLTSDCWVFLWMLGCFSSLDVFPCDQGWIPGGSYTWVNCTVTNIFVPRRPGG